MTSFGCAWIQMVNMNHELIILSKEVDWWIENELKDSYSEER